MVKIRELDQMWRLARLVVCFGALLSPAAAQEGTANQAPDAYRVAITVAQEGHESKDGIAWKVAAEPDVKSYRAVLDAEWAVYPPELLAATKLKRIILCVGLAYGGQLRAAIPDFDHDDLYLDVLRGRYNETYVRKVIHHEFFHIIDLRDDGKLYSDPDWAALNPPGFKYGAGGSKVQNDSTVGVLNGELQGFLDKYAMAGVEEDKAEMFSAMVVTPNVVEERAEKDGVIRAKAARIKELLRKFCAKVDDNFWKAAAAVKRVKDK